MKKCSRCKIEKELLKFRRGNGYRDNLRAECRDCENSVKREKWKNRKIDPVKEERLKEYRRNYHMRDDIKKRKSIKHMVRSMEDELYNSSKKIRSLIYQSIKKMGYTKRSKTNDILGCDFNFFKNYIEKQFVEGMSWDNHGDWHLDHIIPISTAKCEKDIIVLNHYTNFQPLWAIDNLKKSNKINKYEYE